MPPPADSALEVHGDFWLPGAEDKKISGVLSFTVEQGGTLKLIGTFTKGHLHSEGARTADYSRILGRDDKTVYTLDSCLRIHETQTLGKGGRQTFYVGQVVKDVWFEKDEAIEAEMVDVEIDHLLTWTGISGLRQESTPEGEPGDKVTERRIIGVRQEPRTVELPFGKLELRHAIGSSVSDHTGWRMNQNVVARFDFGALRLLSEAIDYASDLQDLVSIATQRSAAFGDILLYQEAWNGQIANGGSVKHPARFYSEWRVRPDPDNVHGRRDDYLFNFEDLDGIEGVGRWMTVAERYRELLGRMMMTRYVKDTIVQDVVISRVATLEGFDRKRFGGGRTELLTRLKRLVRHAGAPFEQLVGAGNVTAWCTKAKDYRNDIAHHSARYPGVEATEMHYIGQAAYWLFVLCLFREAKAPHAVFDRLVQSQRFLFEAEEVQAIL